MSSNDSLTHIALWGPPRSGTTWLGQIFDSHPAVAYRYQPLFSYRFKSAVSLQSQPDAMMHFLSELAATDDDFVCQTTKRREGLVPVFEKHTPTHLAFKEVRYLHLARHFLTALPESRAVGIIRNPCATMNSWLKTPREFRSEWDWRSEWRTAKSKNQERAEEYYGFDRWKWIAQEFLSLASAFPERFTLIRYEDLVLSPIPVVTKIFHLYGLQLHAQTIDFLKQSQSKELDHPDSVFRNPDVKDRWQHELPAEIRSVINAECRGTCLEQFCQ
jgi:Sulfotransferase domain.